MNTSLKSVAVLAATLAIALASGCGNDPAPTAEAPAGKSTPAAAPAARAPVPATAQFAPVTETAAAVRAAKEIGVCSLENVLSVADNATHPGSQPNSYVAGKGQAYKLIGFATNKETKTVPQQVRLALVGSDKVYGLATATGAERPDVAKFFSVSAFSGAGYQADAAFDDVAPGEYAVFVLEGDAAAMLACPTHQTLTVK